MSRAAYMREYRAKRRALDERPKESVMRERYRTADADHIAVLEAEVARLKRELASRPATQSVGAERTYADTVTLSADEAHEITYGRDPIRDPMREFHPAPKPGQKKRG